MSDQPKPVDKPADRPATAPKQVDTKPEARPAPSPSPAVDPRLSDPDPLVREAAQADHDAEHAKKRTMHDVLAELDALAIDMAGMTPSGLQTAVATFREHLREARAHADPNGPEAKARQERFHARQAKAKADLKAAQDAKAAGKVPA